MSEQASSGFWRRIGDAVISPAAIARMPRRTARLFALYLGLCASLLGVVALVLSAYQGELRQMALGYVFPASWQLPVELVVEHWLASQQRALIVNALVGGSMLTVTVLLFPVKELVSASMEADTPLTDLPIEEPPLWEQGWQEVKLFLLFIAAQGTIFWIGYFPNPATRALALALSYLFLWFAFAIDFIAPIFQRHMGQYSQILKTLARHPIASLAFGAVFTAPVIAVGKLWEASPSWSFGQAIALLFGVNMVSIAWAVVSGTWLGARMLEAFAATPRSRPITRVVAWIAVVAVLAGNGYVFGAVALSAQRKSQLLKCEYSIEPSSLTVDAPGLDALLGGEVKLGVSAEVTIHNPTRFAVEIEDNRVEVRHRGALVARTALPTVRVEPGATETARLSFSLAIEPSALIRGRDLLEGRGWTIAMYVAVTDYFELPVYLLRR